MLTRQFLFILLLIATPLQAVTLKIATVAPDGTSWMKAMRQAAKEIKKETDGRVKLRFYPGGVMGNDKSVLRKIRVGQLHGGAITSGGLSNLYPDIQIYSLPFLFRSAKEVDYVRKQMDEKLIAGLKSKGFVSYGLIEGGFAYLMSQTPFSSAEALKQLKIWAPEGDKLSYNAFKSIGVTPVPLAITDVLTGLQTGLIDTVGTTPIGAIALQWHARIKHLADVPLTYIYASLVIKERALKKVSAADRALLQQVLSKTFRELSQLNRQDNNGARKALQKQGISFHSPELDNDSDWKKAMDRVVRDSKQTNPLSKPLLHEVDQLLLEIRTGS